MNIFYLNHYANQPSMGNVGRAHSLAKELAVYGHRMIVICASDHHLLSTPAATETLNCITVEDGVEYLALPVRSYKGNGLKRLRNMLDFCSEVKALSLLIDQGAFPKPDIIIASSVHLFVFPAARRLAHKIGVPIVFEVRDLWPLSLVEIAGVSRWNPIVLWLNLIERRAYRQADAVVSLLPNALSHMHPLGLTADRFFYIPNGICLSDWSETPERLPNQHYEVFNRLKSRGKTVVVYTGSHGAPNALEQVLELKKIIGELEPPYHFVLIGDGLLKTELIAKAHEEKCTFVDFLPRVSKSQSLTAINLADICFISSQDKPIYQFGISPNKLSEYMYAMKPVICAIPGSSTPVQEANSGISVKPFDPFALDAALRSLCVMSPEQREVLGKNGRNYVLKNHEWSILACKYEKILQTLL